MVLSIVEDRLSNTPFAASPNIGGTLRPRFLVMHYTAGGPDFDTAAHFSRRSARVSAHLVIRRDGSTVQCVPFDRVAWHAGRSRWTDAQGKTWTSLNGSAVGIELENWGAVQAGPDGWRAWTGALVQGQVMEARHRFGTPSCGWETYPARQFAAAVAAARCICATYGIAEILGHDDISPGRKSDPGPAWDMAAFRSAVLGTVAAAPAPR